VTAALGANFRGNVGFMSSDQPSSPVPAPKTALDPAEEWRRANQRRREYSMRMWKAAAIGVAVAVAISGALIVGLFSVVEGGWDGSRPRGMAKLLALLCTPGVLVGVWVRNKLKVPNSI
jgi:hypothetical protein